MSAFGPLRPPAISAPIGADKEGLPIGLQIIGDMHQDQSVVELARLIARI